jgi:hypothetical protein
MKKDNMTPEDRIQEFIKKSKERCKRLRQRLNIPEPAPELEPVTE